MRQYASLENPEMFKYSLPSPSTGYLLPACMPRSILAVSASLPLSAFIISLLLLPPCFANDDSIIPDPNQLQNKVQNDRAQSSSLTPNQMALIFDLIDQLESENREVRLQAEAELLELGEVALPLLHTAIKRRGNSVYLYLHTKISQEAEARGKERLQVSYDQTEENHQPPANETSPSEEPPQPAEKGVADSSVFPSESQCSIPLTPEQRKVVEEYFKMKFEHAIALFEMGDYENCLALIDAILIVEPSISIRPQLVRLRLRCKDMIINKRFLHLSFHTDRPYYQYGQTAILNVQIRNLSREVISIDRTEQRMSNDSAVRSSRNLPPASSFMSICMTDHDFLGNSISEPFERPIEFPERLVLAPGESWKMEIPFDTAFGLPDRGTYRTFRFNIVSSFVKVTGREHAFYRRLSFPQTTVRVLPLEFDARLEANPLQSMIDALQQGNMRDLFHSAIIMPDDRKQQAIDILVKSLEESSPEAKRVVMVCLGHITGRNLGVSEARWLKWWTEQKNQSRLK